MSEKLSFSVKDTVSGEFVSPDNVSLPIIQDMAESMARFIKGSSRISLNDIPISVKKGSFALVVENPSVVISAMQDFATVSETGNLDNIDPIRAKVIRSLQEKAKKNKGREYIISQVDAANSNSVKSIVLTSGTNYKTSMSDKWARAEIYMYGKVVDMGGKTKANVHLVLDNDSTIVLDADSQKIAEDNENRLYNDQLVKISAEQNLETKNLRNETLEEFVEYNPHFDEEEFNKISDEVGRSWADVPDITAWVEEVRGNHAQAR